ncbi:Hypoxanthine-guanine phosphoribosyltransferase [Koleobacter methoxysyntrophicus]|uniref:Hypoxanthine phosphoribosyltransferase n=1 Tax=Koleobacter methoxysyntrophicus TaxID=2751313 RepID=A0A8A0RJ38_9FIRM|nr:hypoxanthine phosphoribosyltransferase [Koleobacter methoxysyntrophicus]QSQ08461.1 Hypoxanthine-guanine phosphoribosyltransferase [Koleobacter methoxysyntrophicus]
MLNQDIERVLITREEISTRIKELGEQITRDYQEKNLLLVGVLKGAVVFMADLMREIRTTVDIDFMDVSSYGSSTESSGVVRILKDLDTDIQGKHIIIVEDIIDSGLTLNYLTKLLQSRNPASIKVCVLLDKPERRDLEVAIHYRGFSVPNEFIVGYGLDYDGKYRNLPDICILKPEVYRA